MVHACVGVLQHSHMLVVARELLHEMRANESRAAGDKNHGRTRNLIRVKKICEKYLGKAL